MRKISLHGGHSGQYCDHARDTLADIVAAYHEAGFECIGLTEHMPPFGDSGMYPDEIELGRTTGWMEARFDLYVAEARSLARAYQDRMRILVGMETEWYPGCAMWVRELRQYHALDYVVGSVHHVQGACFDFSKEAYDKVATMCGGTSRMYAAYFDEQFEMLREIKPEVVGHFDLIRLHDPDYLQTITEPEVWKRILRNLEWIRGAGGILDINARALLKGQPEPYVCAPILDAAAKLEIGAAYGDDAHGVADVGYGFGQVEKLLSVRKMMQGPEASSALILGSLCG
ncbi:histidinol-phosphatase (PHP family) [Desulfomicrobium norvegicum]|uniref:Histidinol-phosphatase n=1 Tax=Desulfomicrobium norvegicum (strain DSM 1741 / NCIMB 8310) TaxID=52561 RepID=A0A8G2C4K8_DESNO|nr:histidinol-phosphatase [Desulfomicrobium norvegicum]SFL97763.1 histidinol-phosphatase (PHP family) [Desulfomicrobium norvegicum]